MTWRQELDRKVIDPQLNVWIGHLLRFHNFKYPVEWYISQPQTKVKAMYNDFLTGLAKIS